MSNSFTNVLTRGPGTDKTTASALAVSPSAMLFGGEIVFVVFATDNSATTQGASTTHSMADSEGNTWTKLVERTRTDGAIRDGVTLSVWMAKLTKRIPTTGTITGTVSGFASGNIAKAIGHGRTTISLNKKLQVAGTIGTDEGSDTTPTAVVSGLTSAPYLFIGALGVEGTSGGDDADYTVFSTSNTTGGAGDTNALQKGEGRLFTGTGDTYNVTLPASLDHVAVLIALEEVDDALPWTGTAIALIARTAYDPAATETKTVTDTAGADADATNLAVVFTTPGNGEVLVHLGATGFAGAASVSSAWYLREAAANVFDPIRMDASTHVVRETLYRRLTGISAGSHTWKWALKPSSASGCSIRGGGGDAGYGPFEMEVFSIPANALLGQTLYVPVSESTYTYASSVWAAIDATNLTLTFTTPASGRVLFVLDGFSGGGSSGQLWTPVDSSTVLQAQPVRIGAGGSRRVQVAYFVVGLPVSTSLTWRWGWSRHAGSDNVELTVGPEVPAIMQAWAL